MGLVWSQFRRSVRALGRLLLYAFLLSLPISFVPLVAGVLGGIKYHFWNDEQITANSNAFIFERDQDHRMSYWNVPGAQTIHQFQDNKEPFFLPQLRAMDWTNKLSVSKPVQYPEEDPTIDRFGNLDDLVRKVTPETMDLPTEYWVYVTFWPTLNGNEWDKAFNQILQASYMGRKQRAPAFLYLDCIKSQFLCGVWGVKNPALVHFTIENRTIADLDDGEQDDYPQLWHQYDSPPRRLRPVTARVVELPLKRDNAVHFLPRNILPTPYLQLRTLIFDAPHSAIADHFEHWQPFVQSLRRFQDRMDDLFEWPASYWHYLHKADVWYEDTILEPVFGKDITHSVLLNIQNFAFTFTFVIAQLVRIPFALGWTLYSWYFGLGWDGEPMVTHSAPSPDGDHEGGGMFGDMMSNFWDFALQKIAAQSAEAAAHAAVTEAAQHLF